MIRRNKWIRVILLPFLLACFIFMLPPLVSLAGGLNSSEQDLVEKAKGIFSWNGKQYRAKQAYIDQLVAYLSQEDVDLSADECEAAAGEMYANVERGVMEHYLCEVSEEALGRKGSDSEQAEVDSWTESVAGQREKTGEGGVEDAANGGDKAWGREKDAVSEGDDARGRERDTTDEEKAALAEKVAAPVNFRELDKIFLNRFCNGEKKNASSVFPAETAGRLVNPFFYRIICGFETAFVLLLSVLLIGTVRNGSLKRRRFLRRAVSRFTLCLMGTACFLAGMVTAFWFSAFSEQAAIRQIERTSWYEAVYEEIRQETLMTLEAVSVPGDEFVEALKYDNLVIAARQQLTAELNGHDSGIGLSAAMANVRLAVTQYYKMKYPENEAVAAAANHLMDGLEIRCKNRIHWAGMDWWIEKTLDFRHFLPAGLGGSILIFLMGTAELICLNRFRNRTMKRIGWSLVLGCAMLECSSILLRELERIVATGIIPEYMSEFIRNTSVSVVFSVQVIGGIAGCMAVRVFCLVKSINYEK